MSNQRERTRRTPLARAAALALSAIFVLPSCFTAAIWRANRTTRGDALGISLAETTKAPGPLQFVCRCGLTADTNPDRAARQRALASVCAMWQPPLEPGTWLAIEPTEHAEIVARLWRERPQQCALLVMRGADGAAPRCSFVCTASSLPHPGNIPAGFDRLPGVREQKGNPFFFRVLVFEAECRIAPIAAQGDLPTQAIPLQPCDPPAGTAARLCMTPFTLAIDSMMLEYQLLGLLSWF